MPLDDMVEATEKIVNYLDSPARKLALYGKLGIVCAGTLPPPAEAP